MPWEYFSPSGAGSECFMITGQAEEERRQISVNLHASTKVVIQRIKKCQEFAETHLLRGQCDSVRTRQSHRVHRIKVSLQTKKEHHCWFLGAFSDSVPVLLNGPLGIPCLL
ncbi:hypothetical protein CSKR_106628 [Clonorchis sinensis]|uniref:Uncharacterized protein n=1 Tax=Clonorchis sinensis TaxID=79923 RepID=A0A419QH32_CLOSI|nr:hypothetical protein CSKR_106628 [Clonorchis sinensis]